MDMQFFAPRRRLLAVLILALVSLTGCDSLLVKRSPGERLYRKLCADCHGLDGRGQTIRYMGNLYADLTDEMWRHAGDARGMERTIREGLVFRHSSYEELEDRELRQIVDHILKLRGERRR